jgi:hypothetical protein
MQSGRVRRVGLRPVPRFVNDLAGRPYLERRTTMSTDHDLNPCPCCGSADIHSTRITRGGAPIWMFGCYHCGLSVSLEGEDRARRAWNRRAPNSEVDRLRGILDRKVERMQALYRIATAAEGLLYFLNRNEPTDSAVTKVRQRLDELDALDKKREAERAVEEVAP